MIDFLKTCLELFPTLWPILAFGFCFSMFRELSEHGKEGAFEDLPDWWNTPKAHRNKYTLGPKLFPFLPTKVAVFISKNWLVFISDAEHFFQLLSLLPILAALWASDNSAYTLVYFYLGNALTGAVKLVTPLK